MKKFTVFWIYAILLAFSAYALDRPSQSTHFNFSYAADKGAEGQLASFAFDYGLDWNCIKTVAGTQINLDIFDIFFGASYIPNQLRFRTKRKELSLGLSGIYHLQRQTGIATENDFIISTDFSVDCDCGFSFKMQGGYGFKGTKVDAIYDYTGYIWDRTFVLTFDFEKMWKNGLCTYLKCGSHNFYRYPLFISPIYDFGAAYTFKDQYGNNVQAGGEFEIKFADQFTTAPYISGIQFKLTFGYFF